MGETPLSQTDQQSGDAVANPPSTPSEDPNEIYGSGNIQDPPHPVSDIDSSNSVPLVSPSLSRLRSGRIDQGNHTTIHHTS